MLVLVLGLGACDASEAFREPDPTFARMLQQRRADPYAASAVFPDGRTMRAPPEDTVARGALEPPWNVAGTFVREPPIPRTRAALERGRASFERTCATCHGDLGDGDSVVARKMEQVRPPSLVDGRVRTYRAGELYQIIRDGRGLMPAYAAHLSMQERWEVVLYLRALTRSQRARVADLPPDVQRDLLAKGSAP
jgi:mono/diheme cytochrome c family protein